MTTCTSDEKFMRGEWPETVTPIPAGTAIYGILAPVGAERTREFPKALRDAMHGDLHAIWQNMWIRNDLLSLSWTLLYCAGEKALVGDGFGNTRTIRLDTARAMFPVMRFPLRTTCARIVLPWFSIDLKEVRWEDAGCTVRIGFSQEGRTWGIYDPLAWSSPAERR